jgi:hypothetical protein
MHWSSFFCGVGATIAAEVVIGILLPLVLFATGKGFIH